MLFFIRANIGIFNQIIALFVNFNILDAFYFTTNLRPSLT